MKRQSSIFFIITLFLLITAAVFFNLDASKFPCDDGYFYLQIAQNISAGNGSTFNNVTTTNGYHPLWMMYCSLLSFFVSSDKEMLLRFTWFSQIALLITSLGLLFSILKSANKPLENLLNQYFKVDSSFLNANIAIMFYPAAACLTFIFLSTGTLYLTEAFINLTFQLLLFRLVVFSENSRKRNTIIALIAGLTVLARLDNIFIVAAMLVFRSTANRKFDLRKLVFFGAVTFAVITPYLLWNLINFSHLVPISGAAKSSFPWISAGGIDLYGKITVAILVAMLILLNTAFKDSALRRAMFFFCIGGLVHVLFNYLYQTSTGQWYWISGYIAFAFLVCEIFRKAIQHKKFSSTNPLIIISRAVAIVLLFATIAFAYMRASCNFSFEKSLISKNMPIEKLDKDLATKLAFKLRDFLEPEATVFVWDTPGRLAYYTGLKIVPADGLVNNYDYDKDLSNQGVKEYFTSHKINYILAPYMENDTMTYVGNNLEIKRFGDDFRVMIYSPISNQYCGSIRLRPLDILVQDKNPLKLWQPHYDRIALWRVRCFE